MRHVGGGVSRQGAGHHDHWWVGSDRIGLLSHFLSAAGAAEALRPRAAEGARAERRDEELWKPREPGMLSETSRHGLSLQ